MGLLLGCIADDITGGSDLGLMLAAHGMPTTLCLGTPTEGRDYGSAAVVIALKIRSIDAADAVDQALGAADWLLARGAAQLYYKYCSTFDSTDAGNIGPVTDALLDRLDENFTVLLPAFPKNGRTVRDGVLYVDGVPLAESPMRDHPLTPMKRSSLIELMDAQTAAGRTGLVPATTVARGAKAIQQAFDVLRSEGKRYAVADTVGDKTLEPIAEACFDLKLITGGSGVAATLPSSLARRKRLTPIHGIAELPSAGGYAAVLSGSCSAATRGQVARFVRNHPGIVVDPLQLATGETSVDSLAAEAERLAATGNVLIYSTADPERLGVVQEMLGIDASANLVERTLAGIAERLQHTGTRKFLVAGGETSGAVAAALGATEFEIGPEIDPGVPWMVTTTAPRMCVAFKSGNFGGPDFFERALGMLP